MTLDLGKWNELEYNKNKFDKINDKKVLHKIKKHWVVISLALLSMIGAGSALTSVSANADGNNGSDNDFLDTDANSVPDYYS